MGDLRAAGLNPVLAGLTGGASTPAGQTAVTQNPYRDLNVEGKVASAMSAMRFKKEMRLLDTQTQLAANQSEKEKQLGMKTLDESEMIRRQIGAYLHGGRWNEKTRQWDSLPYSYRSMEQAFRNSALDAQHKRYGLPRAHMEGSYIGTGIRMATPFVGVAGAAAAARALRGSGPVSVRSRRPEGLDYVRVRGNVYSGKSGDALGRYSKPYNYRRPR